MNILDKEKAITLICEYIKSKHNLDIISKVNSNEFCNNVFDTHFSINEFGSYYIIKYNNSTLNKEIINKNYLSFTDNNVLYKLYVDLDENSITKENRTLDLDVKRFGFMTKKSVQYQVLIPNKNYILEIIYKMH